jgi:hypothetical protein
MSCVHLIAWHYSVSHGLRRQRRLPLAERHLGIGELAVGLSDTLPAYSEPDTQRRGGLLVGVGCFGLEVIFSDGKP